METVRQIVDGAIIIPGQGFEITPPPRRNERIFWRRLDFVVGASDGKETRCLYVIYHQTGTVHGYPITEGELRKAGVEI
jgi:hypothetical protein